MDDLVQAMAECLQSLLDSGFEAPLHVAGVARNGSAFVVTYELTKDGLEPTFRLEPNGAFALPVNMMFVDQRGEAARLVIGQSGERHLSLH